MRKILLLLLFLTFSCSSLHVLSASQQSNDDKITSKQNYNNNSGFINTKVYIDQNNGILTQSMFEDGNGNPIEDTRFIIQFDYTLVEDINLPNNSILVFDGGSIKGKHTLIGNNTSIEAGAEQIFGLDIFFKGTWISTANVLWFGAKLSGKISLDNIDATKTIQKAIDSPFYHIYFPAGWYYITKPLVISEEMA